MNRLLGTAIFLLLGINFFRQALVILDIQVTAYRPRKKALDDRFSFIGSSVGLYFTFAFF